jgi:hypothetical protein
MAKLAIAVGFALLLGVDAWALLARAHGAWEARAALVFQLLAVYGIGLGLLSKSGMLSVHDFDDEMTSPNLYRFLAGNLTFIGVFAVILGTALRARDATAGAATQLLRRVLLLAAWPVLALYAAFHMLVLVPVVYLPYALVSALVEAIRPGAEGTQLEAREGDQVRTGTLGTLVNTNLPATKSFLIGFPAVALGLSTRLITLFT